MTMVMTAEYVDAEYLTAALRAVAPVKKKSYERLHVIPGGVYMDVGAGAGIDTCEIGKIIGPTGTVYGVDADARMVGEAQRRAQACGVNHHVHHLLGNAAHLPCSDHVCDGARAERVLMHVADSLPVIREMVRIVKPGGSVVIVETDWMSLSMSTHEPDVAMRLSRFRAQHYLTNGFAAQRVYDDVQTAGLEGVVVDVLPLSTTDIGQFRYLTKLDDVETHAEAQGVLSADEWRRWTGDRCRLSEGAPFWGSLNMLVVSGRVPHR